MATLTVNDTTPRLQYTATAAQTVFAYTFAIFNDTDLRVYVGSTLKTLTTDYTVSGAGTTAGGNITFVSGLSSGDIVTIYRDLPVARTSDYQTGGDLLAETLNDDLDKVVMMVQQIEHDLNNRCLRFGQFTTGIPLSEFTESDTDRAGKVLSFDSSGDPNITQELGVWQGNWAASTAYVLRDLVKDSSNSNVYICTTAHTSSGTTPISSNADAGSWALLVDAATAATSATAAQTAQTAAETAETNAETAETNAETAETNAEAWASKTDGIVEATDYSSKAWSVGGTDVTSTASRGAAKEWATTTGATVDTSEYSSKEWAIGTTVAAGSAKDWASQASGTVDGSEYSAKYYADQASTSATNAATSESNAATYADNFNDTYLGAKASDPSVDNDGDALTAGDMYFNTGTDRMRVYDGSAWANVALDSATVVAKTSSTGSGQLPSGTTAQRDGTPSAGYIRYNTTTGGFEGYSTAWGSIGGGASGAGGDAVFYENDQSVDNAYTISTNKSAVSAGPVTLNATVTIPTGSRWVIV